MSADPMARKLDDRAQEARPVGAGRLAMARSDIETATRAVGDCLLGNPAAQRPDAAPHRPE